MHFVKKLEGVYIGDDMRKEEDGVEICHTFIGRPRRAHTGKLRRVGQSSPLMEVSWKSLYNEKRTLLTHIYA